MDYNLLERLIVIEEALLEHLSVFAWDDHLAQMRRLDALRALLNERPNHEHP